MNLSLSGNVAAVMAYIEMNESVRASLCSCSSATSGLQVMSNHRVFASSSPLSWMGLIASPYDSISMTPRALQGGVMTDMHDTMDTSLTFHVPV